MIQACVHIHCLHAAQTIFLPFGAHIQVTLMHIEGGLTSVPESLTPCPLSLFQDLWLHTFLLLVQSLKIHISLVRQPADRHLSRLLDIHLHMM